MHNQVQSKSAIARRMNGVCDSRAINNESVANGFDGELTQSSGSTVNQTLNGNPASSGSKEVKFFRFYKLGVLLISSIFMLFLF